MHVLVLPSWYPSNSNAAGIFIFEQVKALATYSNATISVMNWGPNQYVIKLRHPIQSICSISNFVKSKQQSFQLEKNLTEFLIPHLTWFSMIYNGNYSSFIKKALRCFESIEREKGRIDIIHAHQAFPAGFIAYHLSQHFSIPYVITEHSCPFPFNEFKTPCGIRKTLIKTLENSSAVIAVSNWLAEIIRTYIKKIPIVLPNSVDTEFFQLAESNRLSNHYPQIFTMTQPIKRKGIDVLLKSIRIVKDKGYKFSVRIGGDGNKLNHYKQLALKYDINDCVVWLGFLSREKALREYQNCDFCIMPSRLESLSMVVLETIACGKPIVSTACGGPQDLVNENNGLLAEPNNHISLADCISQMLEIYPTYKKSIIRQDCIERFSPQVITGRLIQIYQNGLAQ